MASKRDRESGSSASGQPPAKKLMTQLDPVKIGPVYSLEEMDIKVLQFQNKKLAERIEQRRRAEEDLKRRIEQLEQRQSTDDAVLCIVNRYWNQLDEDVRVLLQRFDAEGADELEQKNESAAVTSFLTLLSQWDKQEIEDKLRQRVEFSERAIGKLLQAHDRLLQRKQKLWDVIKIKSAPVKDEPLVDDLKKEDKKSADEDLKSDIKVKDETFDEKVKLEDGSGEPSAIAEKVMTVNINDALREEMDRMIMDNKRLENLVTELHQRHHEITVKNSELQDKLAAAETEVAELKNQVDDLEYQLKNANNCVDKLDRHLADAATRLKTYQASDIKLPAGPNVPLPSKEKVEVDSSVAVSAGVWKNQLNEMATELEDQRELAVSRLSELEKLQQDHQTALQEIEKLKMDLSTLPENIIVETTEYKCLQSQFSVLYNESMQIKTQLDEARELLVTNKNAHLRQIEQMELDELETQKRLRTEMIQMEDTLSQVRREYDVLRIEFEQMLAANEQTGPINREMRNLISSLKNHNEQLKAEVQRYKRKLREAHVEITKLRQEQNNHNHQTSSSGDNASCSKDQDSSSSTNDRLDDSTSAKFDEKDRADDHDRDHRDRGSGKPDPDVLRDLKNELSKSQNRERDLKVLLDMFKNVPKETRDKAQMMAAERRLRNEIEDLRQQVSSLRGSQDSDRRRQRLPEDEAARKMKRLEETVTELQKSLAAQKQEEEAMLSEMEVTGQAFEDMQEQNVRLLQQLREKDDANFKLMSERIKSNQLLKLLREEKDILAEQVVTFQHQVESQNLVVRKLEDKERILINNLAAVEKELQLRQQAQEMYKRKAVESAQTAADLKLHLDKYHAQLKEAQVAVAEKTGATQQQGFKFKRMQEDLATLRKKLDRAKKIEMASSADEVLLEEIREYKEQLTCPSCKVKKKDAVLTKCFHVFCLECLKTRYETRQRKCPKCNATFGANDYHRIYLE